MKNRSLFVDDIATAGTYFAVTIRSPLAKGYLKSVESPPLPRFYTLVRAEDIPGVNQLDDFPVPVLASGPLSYIGEPVALLLGPDEGKLREYAAACTVIADEETPVFSSHLGTPETVLEERKISIGETPEKGSEVLEKQILTTVQGVYKTGIQEHWYADSHGAIAVFSGEKMTVYTASQWPFHVKRSISQVLQLPPESVLVEPTRLGIHLDGKIWYPSLIACHAALGAFITKKSIKLVLTKEEDFRYSPKRNAGEIEIRSALGERGEPLKTEITVTADLGAQGIFTNEILDRTCLGCLGAYRWGQVSIEGKAVKTNIPPQGPFSGFGLSQGFFALERQVSRIADTLRQDPAEWRKTHALKGDSTLAIGVSIEEPPLEELIDTTAAMADYYRKWAAYELLRLHRRASDWKVREEPLRGIGIAVAYQGSGFLYNGHDQGIHTVEATLEKDGFLEIKTSLISSHDTYIRIWREIAMEILAIEGEYVRIHLGNTDTAPDSGPGSNARNLAVITRLVENACRAIQKQRLQEPLPVRVRQSSKPALQAPWEGKLPVPLDKLFDRQALTQLSWGAAVVEVEINPVEFIPQIRGIWLGIDGGRILSEKHALLTLTQSAIHALGWASREQLYYTEGNIPDPFIYYYDIPDYQDLLPIRIGFIRKDESPPKGIGELPFSTIPAAYLQAVSQAMDHPFETIPLIPQDVWETGKLKKQETGL